MFFLVAAFSTHLHLRHLRQDAIDATQRGRNAASDRHATEIPPHQPRAPVCNDEGYCYTNPEHKDGSVALLADKVDAVAGGKCAVRGEVGEEVFLSMKAVDHLWHDSCDWIGEQMQVSLVTIIDEGVTTNWGSSRVYFEYVHVKWSACYDGRQDDQISWCPITQAHIIHVAQERTQHVLRASSYPSRQALFSMLHVRGTTCPLLAAVLPCHFPHVGRQVELFD